MEEGVRGDDLRLVLQHDTGLDIRCSSGEWGGKKSRWMPSGTTSSVLVCQPA